MEADLDADRDTEKYQEDEVVDEQLAEALRNGKERMFVLQVGSAMESLIIDRQTRSRSALPSCATSYHRLLVHRCAAYYRLLPETDPTTKKISVLIQEKSRIPSIPLADAVPLDLTTPQFQFQIMRRIPTANSSSAHSQSSETPDLDDLDPSSTPEIPPFSDSSPYPIPAFSRSHSNNSKKQRMSIMEREAAYNEARSRIFMGFAETSSDATGTMDASSSTSSLPKVKNKSKSPSTSAKSSSNSTSNNSNSSAEENDGDNASTAPTESENSFRPSMSSSKHSRGDKSQRTFRRSKFHSYSNSPDNIPRQLAPPDSADDYDSQYPYGPGVDPKTGLFIPALYTQSQAQRGEHVGDQHQSMMPPPPVMLYPYPYPYPLPPPNPQGPPQHNSQQPYPYPPPMMPPPPTHPHGYQYGPPPHHMAPQQGESSGSTSVPPEANMTNNGHSAHPPPQVAYVPVFYGPPPGVLPQGSEVGDQSQSQSQGEWGYGPPSYPYYPPPPQGGPPPPTHGYAYPWPYMVPPPPPSVTQPPNSNITADHAVSCPSASAWMDPSYANTPYKPSQLPPPPPQQQQAPPPPSHLRDSPQYLEDTPNLHYQQPHPIRPPLRSGATHSYNTSMGPRSGSGSGYTSASGGSNSGSRGKRRGGGGIGDDVSVTSSSSSSSRRAPPNTVAPPSQSHPLPARPDWAVGLVPPSRDSGRSRKEDNGRDPGKDKDRIESNLNLGSYPTPSVRSSGSSSVSTESEVESRGPFWMPDFSGHGYQENSTMVPHPYPPHLAPGAPPGHAPPLAGSSIPYNYYAPIPLPMAVPVPVPVPVPLSQGMLPPTGMQPMPADGHGYDPQFQPSRQPQQAPLAHPPTAQYSSPGQHSNNHGHNNRRHDEFERPRGKGELYNPKARGSPVAGGTNTPPREGERDRNKGSKEKDQTRRNDGAGLARGMKNMRLTDGMQSPLEKKDG